MSYEDKLLLIIIAALVAVEYREHQKEKAAQEYRNRSLWQKIRGKK